MIHRFVRYPAVFVVGTALSVSPAWSQSRPAATPASTPAQGQAQSAYNGVVVEDILVRVNDQIISRSDYERADQSLQQEGRQQGVPANELETRRGDLLRDLIDQQLLLSKGKDMGITGETELIRRLDDIRKQNHLDSMEALEKAAQEQGVSYEDFKANIRNGIITQEVVREEVGRRIQITPSEVQRYYAAHKADFDQPESVRLSEILIPVAPPAPQIDKSLPPQQDAAQIAAAQAKADEIYAKLKAGSKFDELAKTNSSGSTAAQGGDLGNFRRGMLAKALEDKTFVLKAGQFTEPIQTKQGFVILQVTQHAEPGAAQYEQIRQQVEEAAFMSRMQPTLRAYLTTLREQAFIDIKPGYVDSGASPNETKPVYSAYSAPAPKKKKKVDRTRYRQASYRSKSGASKTAAMSTDTGAPAVAAAATATADAAAAQTTGAAATTPAATSSTSGQAAATKQSAATSATMKPGKKEKIRYGQAPRETLPSAGKTETEDAGAVPAAAATAAVADAQTAPEPANPLDKAPAPQSKKRYSERAKQPKQKKSTAPKTDPFAPPPVTPDDAATQKTQAAPLGLGGNQVPTTKPKKKKAPKGEKQRIQDKEKPAPAPPPAAPAPTTNPALTGTPPSTTPAPPATDPKQ